MKTQFQTRLLYTYCRNTYPKGRALMKMYRVNYIHIVEIPTQKGEHSWKCTELSLKRKRENCQLKHKSMIIQVLNYKYQLQRSLGYE